MSNPQTSNLVGDIDGGCQIKTQLHLYALNVTLDNVFSVGELRY